MAFQYRDSIAFISQVPITEDTLYILDIDDTLLRDAPGDESAQILNDPNTNAWLRSVQRAKGTDFYVCTYRRPSGASWTRKQFRDLGIGITNKHHIDYTTDKGDSIDAIVSDAIGKNGTSPWRRYVFVDDNPQAHEQMALSRTYSIDPNNFHLYMIDPYSAS